MTGQSEIVLTLFRAYDPHHARWLTPDPIGEAGGLNLYEYVGGNSINYWDPMGLVDMNLTPRDETGAVRGMDHWNPTGNGFTVGGHGSPCGAGMTDAQRKPLTPKILAGLFLSSPKYTKGTNVTLYMCRTGMECSSGENFAQQLANELGVTVNAPNGYWVLKVYNKSPSEGWISDSVGGRAKKDGRLVPHSPTPAGDSKCEKNEKIH